MSTSGGGGSSGPSRTRSIRQPSTSTRSSNNEPRNTSPSRLPIKPLGRSSTMSSATTSTSVATRNRATSTSTTASGSSSRPPLSSIYTGRGGVPGPGRRASPTTSTTTTTASGENAAPAGGSSSNTITGRPFGRARQASVATTVSTTSTGTTSNSVRTTTSSNVPPSSTTSRVRQPIHGRAKSSVTNLTTATTLRPTSTQIPPTTSATTTTSTTTSHANGSGNGNGKTTPTLSTTPTSATFPNKPTTRSQTLRARSQSQSQGSVAGSTISTSTTSTTTTNAHQQHPHPTSNPQPQLPQPQHRPAFSTHQQHYSPAKSHGPKPLTSTYLAPPSPSKLPANVALTAETARLQTELLQLALLRRDAPAVDAEWRRGARRALGGRFAALRADDAAVSAAERARAERRCVAALLRWSASSTSSLLKEGGVGRSLDAAAVDLGLLDEKVRAMDEILDGVWGLGDPDSDGSGEDGVGIKGRYARCVHAFEAWVERAAKVLAAQRRGGDIVNPSKDHGGVDEGSGAMFLGDLHDGGWRAECAGLTRRLEGWGRALRELGDVAEFESEPESEPEPEPDEGFQDDNSIDDDDVAGEEIRDSRPRGSGLARVLRGCRALVDGMLEELDAMARIERDAAAAENEWVERMGAELRADDESRGEAATPGRGLAGGQLAAPLWSTAI